MRRPFQAYGTRFTSPQTPPSEVHMNKLCTLAEAISLVHDGDCVGLGGNTLNRAPMAAVFELIRQGRKNLRVVKTAGAMDVDALCLGGCAGVVDAGFVSYESQYGLRSATASRCKRGWFAPMSTPATPSFPPCAPPATASRSCRCAG